MTNRRRVRGIDPTGRGAQTERGQALLLWILAATVILVTAAIVVDVGLWLTEKRQAQLAADFAALAAATELKNSDSATVAKGLEFAERNGFVAPDATVTVTPKYNGNPDMVEVTIEQSAPMLFTGFFGAGAFDIGARAVGTDPVEDLDVVMILDRSESIEGGPKDPLVDVPNMKEGARAALEVLDPATRHVALGVMWASDPGDICAASGSSLWVPVGLSADYNDGNGNLNPGSALVRTIDCLKLSNLGTNWSDPIGGAVAVLQGGRASARKAIILLADTHPQSPTPKPCRDAISEANNAKSQGIEIYTIGFAVQDDRCDADNGQPWQNRPFTTALAQMASGNSLDNHNRCASPSDVNAENADGDHFFCQRRDGSLAPVFTLVAQALAREYRLEE